MRTRIGIGLLVLVFFVPVLYGQIHFIRHNEERLVDVKYGMVVWPTESRFVKNVFIKNYDGNETIMVSRVKSWGKTERFLFYPEGRVEICFGKFGRPSCEVVTKAPDYVFNIIREGERRLAELVSG